jgi:hypothetical protein
MFLLICLSPFLTHQQQAGPLRPDALGVPSEKPLLCFDLLKELARSAQAALLSKGGRGRSSAQRAHDGPADSTSLLAAQQSIRGRVQCHWTDAKLVGLEPAGLSATLPELPTILFESRHMFLPFF